MTIVTKKAIKSTVNYNIAQAIRPIPVIIKTAAQKAATERNVFGHRSGSQAEKIDHMLVAGIVSNKQIAMEIGTTPGRVSSHKRHLKEKYVNDVNVLKALNLVK